MHQPGLALIGSALVAGAGHAGTGPTVWQLRSRAAAREAAAVLAALPLPPGAVRDAREPPTDGGGLAHVPVRAEIPDAAEAAAWWLVPGSPTSVSEYVHARLPGTSEPGTARLFTTPDGVTTAGARLAEDRGVLGDRWVWLSAVALPTGQTALRADVQVVWQLPRRPLPRGIRSLLVTARLRGPQPTSRTFRVTARARVHATIALIEGLAAVRPRLHDLRSCPAGRGALVLRFQGASSTRALALVSIRIGGCGGTQVRLPGGPPEPPLEQPALPSLWHALGVRLVAP